MNNSDVLKLALRGMLFLSVLLMVAGIYLAAESRHSFEHLTGIDSKRVSIIAQLQASSDIERTIGYAHFIHNFKNAVLRGQPQKMRLAQADLDRARRRIGDLRGLNPELGPILNDLERTLDEYRIKSDIGLALIEQGLPPREIDRRVAVDDTAAEAALLSLDKEINKLRNELDDNFGIHIGAHNSAVSVGTVFAVTLILGAMILGWIYVVVMRQSKSLFRARDLLLETVSFVQSKAGADSDDGPTLVEIDALDAEKVEDAVIRLARMVEEQQRDLVETTTSLRIANEDLNRFAYAASHDLQDPLRKIQSNIELLEKKHGKEFSEDQQKYFERVARAAGDMRNLIEDLLNYSRRSTETMTLLPRNLHKIVDEAIAEIVDKPGAGNGKFVNMVPKDMEIVADSKLLGFALDNLLDNAVKYARDGVPPDVCVSAVADSNNLSLCVADNGIGFDPEYAEQIFLPFVRLHGRSLYPGTGIGLSIVKKVAMRHGGTVGASPRGDQGAAFSMTLPKYGPEKKEETR